MPKATPTCKIDGCDHGGPLTRGWCRTHYSRWWKTGSAGLAEIDPHVRGVCSIEECDNSHYARGWCRNHYNRWERTGTPAGQEFFETCTIEGCNRPHQARGWCNTHYQRWRIHGDSGFVLKVRGETGGVRTYEAQHQWLKKTRGPARSHRCVECGGRAAHWAYDHQDPDELLGPTHGRFLKYSTKAEHYQPMCVRCHWAFDDHPMLWSRNAQGKLRSRGDAQ